MKLLLMRHGEAEPRAKTDSGRSLTPYGREQVSAVAGRLSDMRLEIQASMVSPYLRARQTADILTDKMGGAWPEQVSDAITPERSPGVAFDAINDCFGNIDTGLVVMHQPIISRLVYYLTGQDQPMGTANLAVVDTLEMIPGCCELKCVI